MEIIIHSPHFTLSAELNDFVKSRISRLSHLYGRIETANILLKLENSDSADNKVCEIRLVVPGNDLFAKKQSDSFEDATTKTIDALHEQMEKMKTKFERHF